MHPAIVGYDIGRHRENSCVPLCGQHIYPSAGQDAVRCDQAVMDSVDTSDDAAHTREVKAGHRCTSEHPGPGACQYQRSNGFRRQLHVGVQVNTREGAAEFVPDADRVGLARYGRLHNADVKRPRDLGRSVDARIWHHDYVKLTRGCRGQEVPKIRRDDGFLVVRRHDDTDNRSRGAVRLRIVDHVDLQVGSSSRTQKGRCVAGQDIRQRRDRMSGLEEPVRP
jgi:hypothetical protein